VKNSIKKSHLRPLSMLARKGTTQQITLHHKQISPKNWQQILSFLRSKEFKAFRYHSFFKILDELNNNTTIPGC
jgi:hypothetical protein